MRSGARRALGALAPVAAVLLLTVEPAYAHAVGGAEPSNYRVTVTSIRPPAPGVEVEVGVGGQWVRLTSSGSAAVTVLGYAGEPFLRLQQGVVAVNRHATTLADNPRLSPVPARPNAAAAADWVRVGAGRSATWVDDRLTGGDDGRRAGERGRWTLPLRVGGTPAAAHGTWRWVPPPSPWPWAAGLAAVTLAVAAVGWLPRWHLHWHVPAAAVLALAGAASAAHLAGSALAARPGSAASAWGTAAGLGLLCWPLVIVGVVTACRRSEHAAFAVATAGAVLAIVTGPGDLAVLWHSRLPLAWAPAVERALVAATLGAGVGLAVAGVRLIRGDAAGGRADGGDRLPGATPVEPT